MRSLKQQWPTTEGNYAGIDMTDVSRSFTTDKWEKLKPVGGHAYVYLFNTGHTVRYDIGQRQPY